MTPKMLFEELFNLENFKNVLETSEKAHRKSLQKYYRGRKQNTQGTRCMVFKIFNSFIYK